ncbi:MAG TPA: HAD-IA family hydrolase [Gammaproteobacteria bacterium]|nr:HAD-IA family hydrolase [Gammaproteobacteria bacterium]
MYDIILFDLDDTLLGFISSERESLKRIHAEFYGQLDFAVFEENFMSINRELWSRVGKHVEPLTPSEIRIRRFIEFNQKFKINHDHMIIANNYEKYLGETAGWLPGVKEAIEDLHKKNYLLGIVTNGLVGVQYKKHERHELARWFKSFVVSDRVNVAKPHKGIFELALAELKALDLKKVLMVGDSLHADGHGAKNTGIDFCLVGQGSPAEIQREQGIPVRYRIPSVCELPQIIGARP